MKGTRRYCDIPFMHSNCYIDRDLFQFPTGVVTPDEIIEVERKYGKSLLIQVMPRKIYN
jgi:hypothetical protein